jgi:hypothetical protein
MPPFRRWRRSREGKLRVIPCACGGANAAGSISLAFPFLKASAVCCELRRHAGALAGAELVHASVWR